MFVDPQVAYQIPTTPIMTQILAWVNGLTLPGIIIAAITASRWVTKKEDGAKAIIADVLSKMDTIRSNDLHHVQLSLDRMEAAQGKTAEAMTDMKESIVAAQNSSKDAIVQAILTLKS